MAKVHAKIELGKLLETKKGHIKNVTHKNSCYEQLII